MMAFLGNLAHRRARLTESLFNSVMGFGGDCVVGHGGLRVEFRGVRRLGNE